MKIEHTAIIGMGAVGIVYAKRLYDRYGDQFFAIAQGERAQQLLTRGAVLDGAAFFPRVCEPGPDAGPADLILICVKNYQLDGAIEALRPFVGEHTVLLPLLNGVTATARLRAAFPGVLVLCGLAMALDAVRSESGVQHSSDGELHFGMEDTMQFLAEVTAVEVHLRSAGLCPRVFMQMQPAVWKKWMLNVGLNQVSALTGATYGDFTYMPEAMALAESAMREVLHLAQAAGIALTEADIQAIPPVVAAMLPAGKTSMLQDIEAGRPTEVEAFAGEVLRLGRQYGVSTPVNQLLYHLLRVKEQTGLRRQSR